MEDNNINEYDTIESMDVNGQIYYTSMDHNTTLDENDVPDFSEISRAESPFDTDNNIVTPKDECLEVEERKFIVFESCLDKLLSNLRCPKDECFEKNNKISIK